MSGIVVRLPVRYGCKVPSHIKRRKEWRSRPEASVSWLLSGAIQRGLQVKTEFLPDAVGVDVPEAAYYNPVLVWNNIGGAAFIQGGAIYAELRFKGVPQMCRVPLSAVRVWRVEK